MNVKLIRTTTGEDIICDLIEETDDSVTFSKSDCCCSCREWSDWFCSLVTTLVKERQRTYY